MKGQLATVGRNLLHFVNTNNTKIMTCAAIFGVVGTAASSVEAYKITNDILESHPNKNLSFKDKVALCWWAWLKPVTIGGITIGCIAGAEITNEHKQLEMIAAYDILKTGSEKFRDYALDEIGKKKVREIEHKIHEDDIRSTLEKRGLSDEEIAACDAEHGGALFKDTYTGQIFPSTYERIYRAMDRVNDRLASVRSQDEHGVYNGGANRVTVAEFIEDCGGEYSAAAEKYVFYPIPYGKPLPSKSDICDPVVMEYKGHMCTIVQLNYMADDYDFFEPSGKGLIKR